MPNRASLKDLRQAALAARNAATVAARKRILTEDELAAFAEAAARAQETFWTAFEGASWERHSEQAQQRRQRPLVAR